MGMDALSWKTSLMVVGRRGGIDEVGFREHCNGKSRTRRCDQFSVHCEQAELKSRKSSSSSSPPSCQGTISPLPLPSLFPVPLKFFWFGKKSEEDVGRDIKSGLNDTNNSGSDRLRFYDDAQHSASISLEQVQGPPRSLEQVQDLKSSEQLGRSFEEKDEEEERKQNAEINIKNNGNGSGNHDLGNHLDLQNPIELNELYGNSSAKESCERLHSDQRDVTHNWLSNENRAAKSNDESRQESHNSWVVRILEFRDYLKEQKKSGKHSSSSPSSTETDQEPFSSQKGHQSTRMPTNSNGEYRCFEESCSDCSDNDDDFWCSTMKEVACKGVIYDRDSFSKFLYPISLQKTKFLAQMAFLCNLAYGIPAIKPAELWKFYRLRFVTSSLNKKAEASTRVERSTANDGLQSTSSSLNEDSSGKDELNSRLSISPSVAYEIAASAASYIHSQAKYILPFTSTDNVQSNRDENPNAKMKHDTITEKNNQVNNNTVKDLEDAKLDQRAPDPDAHNSLTNSEQSESSKFSGVSKSEMAAIVATSSVTALVAAEEDAKQAAAKELQSSHSSPCQWFICDDESSCTRYFVIQGSDSLASWQANLFFEPTQFEGSEVLVHRGIYEAAKGIYEQLLPDILYHLEKYGNRAKLQFTGHSLGGSLSVLLNLMLLIRGIASKSLLLPVITFGSPCIMCGGDYLLQRLGLPNNYVQAVTIHRDIVPRAFSCNYPDHVAELLKRVNVSLRNHPCLSFQKFLYGSTGQLLILQPDENVSPPHPLLPSGSGCYILQGGSENENELRGTHNVRAAQITFFNNPHPLEILSDRSAYGRDGSISRDHDSCNYLKAINYILCQQTRHLRRMQREQRRQMWWPLVTPDSFLTSHRLPKAAANKGSKIVEDSRSIS